MTPAAIIREAAAAGVSLALSPTGTIKAVGNPAAMDRWVPLLREHKTAILAVLIAPAVTEETSALATLWARVSITEPGGRTVEVDTPSGWTLPDWQAYAERYHGPGCAVVPIAGLPKPRAPVNLDEVLRAACEGVEGITRAGFHSLLSPEDLEDIAAGAIHSKTLRAYARSFAEGIQSGRVVVLPGWAPSP